jgi:hypothetical protein
MRDAPSAILHNTPDAVRKFSSAENKTTKTPLLIRDTRLNCRCENETFPEAESAFLIYCPPHGT